MRVLGLLLCLGSLTLGQAASALTLGGFTFDLGEQAFADDGFLISGTIRWWCGTGTSIQGSISGSDLSDCLNNDTGNSGIVEVLFLDNTIVNGPGTDLVIFELSGHLDPGTPDPRERFGVSIFDGSAFSPFVEFNPIATGMESFPGALDIFVVEIDLTNFGLAAGAETQRVRVNIFDVGLGTKSADIGALGALNSSAVPEPTAVALLFLGMTGLFLRGRSRRFQCHRMRALIYSSIVWFVASSGFATTIPANTLVNFTVDARAGWVSTGLSLNEGDTFALTATGVAAESDISWQNGGRTPDGDGGGCDTCLVTLPASRYALVGRIGSDEFIVGSSYSAAANDTGVLYLAFNDSAHDDNFGSYVVSTASVPEPSAVALLGIGLAGLGVRGARTRVGKPPPVKPDGRTL